MKILITEQQFNLILLGEGAKSLWWKEIKQAVKLCDNIDEFEIKFAQLYDSARKQGLVGYIKTLFYDKMTPEQIKQEILDGYIDENGKLVKYKGREDLRLKNRKLYVLSGKISKKYDLMKGVDDILTQVFPITYKYGFNVEKATVEQVLDYIESMGYKTQNEFITKSNTVYRKIPNEVREKVMKHLEIPYDYKYGFNPRTATFEQVLEYIKSMGYKTKDEFKTKSITVYTQIPNEVREKVMGYLESSYDYKYGFNVEKATVEQVLDYIESMGYKTKDEFITKSNTVYNDIPKEVREKVMKHLERTYKHGFNPKTTTFEQVLEYIKSMGYKTKEEFITKSYTVYNHIPKEVRGKVMEYFKNLNKKQYYNNQTSSNPNISFKYSVKEV